MSISTRFVGIRLGAPFENLYILGWPFRGRSSIVAT